MNSQQVQSPIYSTVNLINRQFSALADSSNNLAEKTENNQNQQFQIMMKLMEEQNQSRKFLYSICLRLLDIVDGSSSEEENIELPKKKRKKRVNSSII